MPRVTTKEKMAILTQAQRMAHIRIWRIRTGRDHVRMIDPVEVELAVIVANALEGEDGNRRKAALRLGVARSTLLSWIRRYRIDRFPRGVKVEEPYVD